MAETTSTLRARLQVEGADDLVRAFQTSSQASQKLETQLGKLGESLSNISNRFDEIKAIALGGLATSKFVSEFSKFQKTLFDLNATAKVTGQNFGDMKKAIEALSVTTSHSKDEIASFYKQVNDGVRGIKLTSDEFSKLTKTLTAEFGPSINDVSDAMKDLTAIQSKSIDVLKTLNVNMTDKQIQKYAGALMRVYGISEKQAESLARTQKAFRDQGQVVDEEQQQLRKFNDQMQNLEKTFRNLIIEIGQPVSEAIGNMATHVKDAAVWFNDLVKSSGNLKAAFGWLPYVAAGVAGVTASIKLLKGAMGIGSSMINLATLLGGSGGSAGGKKGPSSVPGSGGGMGGLLGGFGKFSFVGDALKVYVVGSGVGAGAGDIGGGSPGGRGRGRGRGARGGSGSNGSGLGGTAMAVGGTVLAVGGNMIGDEIAESGHDRVGAGVSALSSIGGGALSGAGMGSMFGPWGTVIGTIIGAGLGIAEAFDEVKEAIGINESNSPKWSGDPTQLTNVYLGPKQSDKEKANVSEEADINARLEERKMLNEQAIQANNVLAHEAMIYSNNVEEALGLLENNVTARKEELKLLQQLNDSNVSNLKEMTARIEAAKASGESEEKINGLILVQKSLNQDILTNRGKIAAVNVDITQHYKAQQAALRQQTETKSLIVDQLQAELDLTNAMFMGISPSLEKQMQIVDAIRDQSAAIDVEIAKQKELYNLGGVKGIEAQQTLIKLQTEKTRLAQKELEITKHLREGYLGAIQAFTNVEGAFSKVILTQDMGVDEIMNKFGARGAAGAGHKFGANEAAIQWNPDGSMKMGENQASWEQRYKQINNYNPFAMPSAARAGNDFQKSLMNQQLIGASGTGSGVFSGPAAPSGPNAIGGKNGITEAINDSILKDLVKGAQGPSGSSGASGVAGEVKKAKDEVQRMTIKAQTEVKKDTGAVENALQNKAAQYMGELKKQNEVINQHLNTNSWDNIAEQGGLFGTTIGARSKAGGKQGAGKAAARKSTIKNSDLKKDNFRELAGVISRVSAASNEAAAIAAREAGLGKNDKFADLEARSPEGSYSRSPSDGTWKTIPSDGTGIDTSPAFTPISSLSPNVRPEQKHLNIEIQRQKDRDNDMFEMAKKRISDDAWRPSEQGFEAAPSNRASMVSKFKEREERGDYTVLKASMDQKRWQEATESVFGKIEENQAKQIDIEKDTGQKIEGALGPVGNSPPGTVYGPSFLGVPGKATGGPIPGYGGGDRHPTMLEGGEFVLRKEAVKSMGLTNAFALNGMASGGLVGGAIPSPSMARSGGGGFNPRFAINVRGDSVRSILSSVEKQLSSTLNDMMTPSGTSGRSFDMNNNG